MTQVFKKAVVALLVLALAGGAAAWYFQREGDEAVAFRTAKVTRGDLLISISATGTLEPEEVIDVGAQVAGQIMSFGKDANGKTVDYGSQVEAGTVLAQIDDTLYRAQAAEADAQLQQAQAGVQVANANLGQAKAKLDQAQRDWDRAQKLGPSEALAQAQYDSYRSAYETAQANVALSEASIVQAQAAVAQAQAASQRAHRNLDYTTIRSPVKGVIIDRRVNTGQTVVASLNAPSLFLLAKDLTHMQVWVAVNEADIGKIHPGQAVTFTVDAFPGQMFKGEVGKVRLNASMTQNVVTYTVEIITDNASGQLLPYLTANVQFELDRRNDVLTVPNAALRWTPSADQIVPQVRDTTGDTKQPSGPNSQSEIRNPKSKDRQPGPASDTGTTRGTIWAVEGKYVRPVPVQVGVSDGSLTEVQGRSLTEGMEIVTGIQPKAAAASDTDSTNPFAPRFPRRGPAGGAGGQRGGGTGGMRGGAMGGPPGR